MKPVPVYGKGENVRDWLFVEDHAAAIDLIFHEEDPKTENIMNILFLGEEIINCDGNS